MTSSKVFIAFTVLICLTNATNTFAQEDEIGDEEECDEDEEECGETGEECDETEEECGETEEECDEDEEECDEIEEECDETEEECGETEQECDESEEECGIGETITEDEETCLGFKTDYNEIIDLRSQWPKQGEDSFPLLKVTWRVGESTQTFNSQCCWLRWEDTPRCIKRSLAVDVKPSTSQVAWDESISYEHLWPIGFDELSENYRGNVRFESRALITFFNEKKSRLWGFDIDMTASVNSSAYENNLEGSYRLYPRALNVFVARSWMPVARLPGAEENQLAGRNVFGIIAKLGVVRQSTEYATTFDDRQIYNFVGRERPYSTEKTYRNNTPLTHTLLQRAGLEGRSNLGAGIESNQFYTVPKSFEHVLGWDFNMKFDLLGPALLASNDSMTIEYPVAEWLGGEQQWEKPIDLTNPTGLIVAPKANIGLTTKTNTVRAHLGFSGEYSLVSGDSADTSGTSSARHNLTSTFFDLSTNFLNFKFAYLYLNGEIDYQSSSIDTFFSEHHLLHYYVSFHPLQIFRESLQDSDKMGHYVHALTMYYENLKDVSHKRENPPPDLAPNYLSQHRGHHFGLTTVLPLFPGPKRYANNPSLRKILFLQDISMTTFSNEHSLTALWGIRVSP